MCPNQTLISNISDKSCPLSYSLFYFMYEKYLEMQGNDPCAIVP